MLVRVKILTVNTVSRRYRCAACHSLKFFAKINLRIQKARVGVFLCVRSTSLGYFLLCPAINRETKFASVYNESFGDFIGTILANSEMHFFQVLYIFKGS